MAWTEIKQGKKGKRYLVRYREPISHKVVSRSFRRAEDARTFRLDIERQIDRREYTPQAERKVALEDYVAKVIESDWNLSDSTRYSHRVRFNKWIRGTQLGRTPLDRVTTTQLRQFLESINNGPWSRGHIYKLLAKAFNQAVGDNVLQRSPLKGVKAPKGERKKKIEPLPVHTIEALAENAKDDQNRLAIHLAAYAGLRAGEVGGLRIQDVDQLKNRISIVQATSRAGGKSVLGPVKTKGSSRKIEVPRFLIEEILAYVEAHGTAEDGRILRTPRGSYLEHVRLNQECQAAAQRAGLPPINFHSLRHTAVSLLIQSGANPKRVQEFVGHARPSITLDIYSHLFPSDEGELAARMAELREQALASGKVVPLRKSQSQ